MSAWATFSSTKFGEYLSMSTKTGRVKIPYMAKLLSLRQYSISNVYVISASNLLHLLQLSPVGMVS